jgi:hypothetical protein
MSNQLVEYIKLHKISLEQDGAFIEKQMDEFSDDYDSNAYVELEVAEINNNGQIEALAHILQYAEENQLG